MKRNRRNIFREIFSKDFVGDFFKILLKISEGFRYLGSLRSKSLLKILQKILTDIAPLSQEKEKKTLDGVKEYAKRIPINYVESSIS